VDTTKKYDVIIIGGGPAGMSSAVWCSDLGLKPLLIDKSDRLGGQLWWIHNPISNYLGIQTANGAQLATIFEKQTQNGDVEIITGQEVASADLSTRTFQLGDRSFTGDAVIIASGVRRRRLGIPGEDRGLDWGILTSGARDREMVKGKRVVIVGGGDAALENALILSGHADQVTVIHRGAEFSARREFVDAARGQSNVHFVLRANLLGIEGSEQVERAVIDAMDGVRTIDCDAVLIRIGVEPNTDFLAGQVLLDDRRYVVVDTQLRTSKAGVWAVGDISGPIAMTIAGAVGHGAVAAASIYRSLREDATT